MILSCLVKLGIHQLSPISSLIHKYFNLIYAFLSITSVFSCRFKRQLHSLVDFCAIDVWHLSLSERKRTRKLESVDKKTISEKRYL